MGVRQFASNLKANARFRLELLKRWRYDFARNRYSIHTPLEIAINDLRLRGLNGPLIALEVFGMYGLRVTRDYIDQCSHLDFWENDARNYRYAQIALRKYPVTYHFGDSIRALGDDGGSQFRSDYNLIVVDNPVRPFGPYCEHFEVLPNIWKYVSPLGCAIVTNICQNPHVYSKTYKRIEITDWISARRNFYGRDLDNMNIHEKFKFFAYFYSQQVPSHLTPKSIFFIPRGPNTALMVQYVEQNDSSES